MAGLMAHRDARLYVLGQCLSVAGDSALWLGMAIWVRMLTGSNGAAGLTFFAFICGSLLAPVSGMLADRVPRKPLLVWANLGSAAAVCALLPVAHRGEVWLVYAVMFVYGVVGSLIISAQTALLATMLPEDLLGDANTVLQMAEQGLRVVTPVVGAGLVAWIGPKPVILLDAATFLVAALATAALRVRETPVPPAGHWRAELTAGLAHIGRTPALRRLLVAGVIALVAFGFLQPVSFAVVAQGLHRSPPFLGVLEVAMGAGALAGGIGAMAVMRRTGERGLVLAGVLAAAAGCLLLTTGRLAPVLVAMALIGACFLAVNVGGYTLIQRATPNELIGRVDAALSMAIMVPQAAALALGSGLVGVLDYRVLLVAMAAVLAVAAVPLLGRAPAPDAGRPTTDTATQMTDTTTR